MAISQELENAIRGSIHSASGAIELIDRCNANIATDTYAAASITNLVVTTAVSANSILFTNLSGASASLTGRISVPSITATNLVLATNLTALAASVGSVSIGGSNISALTGTFKQIDCSTSMTCPTGNFPALKATNMTLASNVTALTGVFKSLDCSTGITALGATAGTNGIQCISGPMVLGSKHVSGGSAAVDTQAVLISAPVAYLVLTDAAKQFFKLPAASAGLCQNVINCGTLSAGLVGRTAGVSINSATSVALQTANATGAALDLICDGTDWWKRAQ